jgi:hypothetical protein
VPAPLAPKPSLGIALLATLYASRARAAGSPAGALHDDALALTIACAAGAVAALTLRGRPCPAAGQHATMGAAVNDAG